MDVLAMIPADMTPEQSLAWLNSEEAVALLSKSARKRAGKRLRGALVRDAKAHAHRRRLQRTSLYPFVCSAWWAEVIFADLDGAGLLSDAPADNADRALKRGVYPPVTEREGTGMRRCVECGAWHPRANVSTDRHGHNPVCDDCGSSEASHGLERVRAVLVSNERATEFRKYGMTFQRSR
jgi:hypothetical protein